MLLVLALCALVASVSADSCAYRGCHPVVPGKLNVHLVPHTHDDVGWLKTVDQYYYGSNKVHAPFGVQYILDSVVSELLKHKQRRWLSPLWSTYKKRADGKTTFNLKILNPIKTLAYLYSFVHLIILCGFIYVESSFLWRWWQEQEAESKAAVVQLVQEGRLQLVHGGWCMSDEATPHYSMLIDQMTFGLKFLKDTFGECGVPKIAWQIDPFGHSSEVALQFAEMGFDALFVGRIDQEDYRQRVVTKSMEHIWRPDTSTGELGELFMGILFNLYHAPSGFCFDAYCSDEPIMDNPKLHGYNVNERITDFMREVRFWAEAYKTNNVQVTMGGDFNYVVAASWFKNMDKLIKYINSKFKDVNVVYSTPACYLKALNDVNATWPVKDNDDFFPYGSDEHTYWTGYFTSRPNLKNLVYRANNVLQGVKQLRVTLGTELEEEEFLMSRAVGIAQHHDAVSGTEKQHVSDDYSLYLSEGLDASEKIFHAAYKKWLGNELPTQKFCRLLNVSQCEQVETATKFTVTIYNPRPHKVSHPIRVPVTLGSYKVIGPTGEEIPNELVPVPQEVKEIPGRSSNSSVELLFMAEDIPPLGLLSYHVERFEGGVLPVPERQNISWSCNNTNITYPLETSHEEPDDIEVDNGILKLVFNGSTGHLQLVVREQVSWAFFQNFYYYEGSKGYNYNSHNRASGAYIFRPAKDEVEIVSPYANLSIFRGKQVTEVHQQFGPWVSQIIRLYPGKDQIEFQWLVGPLPVEKWIGKEVITRYKTQLMTNGELYTDSNGRRLMKRVRNFRKSWNLTLTEPVASNYYPVTSAAAILGNKHRVTVLTDRPQGAASLSDGEIEVMLHRRLLYDDSKGVSEPLDEMQYNKGLVARGLHIVQLSKTYKEPKARTDNTTANTTSASPTSATNTTGTNSSSSGASGSNDVPFKYREGAERHRVEAQSLVYGPLLTFSQTTLSAPDWSKKFRMKYTGMLREPLPVNIHLLTLERWNSSLLLRLEHLFEANEHPLYSQPVSVSLKNLFVEYEVSRAVELNLAANQELSKTERLKWSHEGSRVKFTRQPLDVDLDAVLSPMDIRTFQLFVSPRKPAAS